MQKNINTLVFELAFAGLLFRTLQYNVLLA